MPCGAGGIRYKVKALLLQLPAGDKNILKHPSWAEGSLPDQQSIPIKDTAVYCKYTDKKYRLFTA